jgi:hypothetical protein
VLTVQDRKSSREVPQMVDEELAFLFDVSTNKTRLLSSMMAPRTTLRIRLEDQGIGGTRGQSDNSIQHLTGSRSGPTSGTRVRDQSGLRSILRSTLSRAPDG